MATRTVLVDSNVYLLQFTIKIQLIPPGTKSQGSVCWLKLSLLPLNTGPSTVLEEFLKRAVSRKSLIPKPLLAVVPVRAEWVTFSNHMCRFEDTCVCYIGSERVKRMSRARGI